MNIIIPKNIEPGKVTIEDLIQKWGISIVQHIDEFQIEISLPTGWKTETNLFSDGEFCKFLIIDSDGNYRGRACYPEQKNEYSTFFVYYRFKPDLFKTFDRKTNENLWLSNANFWEKYPEADDPFAYW